MLHLPCCSFCEEVRQQDAASRMCETCAGVCDACQKAACGLCRCVLGPLIIPRRPAVSQSQHADALDIGQANSRSRLGAIGVDLLSFKLVFPWPSFCACQLVDEEPCAPW